MQPVDLYTTYAFLKRLVTPFKQWKAYKLGIIDADGNQVKLRKDLQTQQEREAFGYLDILALNMKKLLAKVPGGNTTLGTYAAALLLMKERVKVNEADDTISDFENQLHEALSELEEDAPANAVGSGNIAGAGVGPQGEPPVNQNKYKKRNAEGNKQMLSRVQTVLTKRNPPQ
jgi:hypothetical protein